MNAERWEQVKAVFASIADSPSDQRDELLAAACEGDPDLREEILSLLAAEGNGDRDAVDLVEGTVPDLASLVAHAPSARQGQQLGPYRLLREIGRGGMSEVYLAVRADDAYDKRVAVKVILAGMDSADGRERLRRERQILAALDHPNLCRLLDGGTTPTGLPYLVMDYVEGSPIDEFCDRGRLSVAERLALFEQVCSAVHYAHQNLVVHRDLKPSNLLVEADGTPKLLDFGIAKLLNPELGAEASLATGPGLHFMTPSYSSPEQLRGEAITTATDVYSLGVMLYELLVGQRPYELAGRSRAEVERAICELDPVPPSRACRGGEEVAVAAAARSTTPESLARCLAGDLDAVVLRALAKEPRRRYSSAGELAEDLARHRSHQPVAAHRDSFGYRLSKVVRRHRLASALVAGLAVLGIGLGVQSVRLSGALSQTEAEKERSEQVLGFLERLFTETEPQAVNGGATAVAELLVGGAQTAERQFQGQPAVLARLYNSIGMALRKHGRYDEARPLLERGLSLRRSLFGAEHPEVAESLDSLGQLHLGLYEFSEAEAYHREALAMRESLFGPRHLDVAESLNNLGEVVHTLEHYDEAENLYRRALTLREDLLGPEHRKVAETLGELGFLLQDRGDYESSERIGRQTLALKRRLFGNEHSEVATALDYLGWTLQQKGEYAPAEDLYREALAMRERLFGEDHPGVASLQSTLGWLRYARGDFEEAEALLRASIATWQRCREGDHAALGTSITNLASVLRSKGQAAEAVALYERSRTIFESAFGPGHSTVATVLIEMAKIQAGSDRARAEMRFVEALEIRRAALPEGHLQIGDALRDYGHALVLWGEPERGERLLRESLATFQARLPSGDWRIADVESRLGACLTSQGRYPEAQVLLDTAHTTLIRTRGAEDRFTQRTEERLADLASRRTAPVEAGLGG